MTFRVSPGAAAATPSSSPPAGLLTLRPGTGEAVVRNAPTQDVDSRSPPPPRRPCGSRSRGRGGVDLDHAVHRHEQGGDDRGPWGPPGVASRNLPGASRRPRAAIRHRACGPASTPQAPVVRPSPSCVAVAVRGAATTAKSESELHLGDRTVVELDLHLEGGTAIAHLAPSASPSPVNSSAEATARSSRSPLRNSSSVADWRPPTL